MSKITLQEVVQKMLKFEGKEKATMIGIGPMSKTLIKACMILAKEKDFPLMGYGAWPPGQTPWTCSDCMWCRPAF